MEFLFEKDVIRFAQGAAHSLDAFSHLSHASTTFATHCRPKFAFIIKPIASTTKSVNCRGSRTDMGFAQSR
jgi:hypothetical protein